MTMKEKAAYVKGLFSGLELDEDKKETKLLSAIIDWMDEASKSIDNLEEDVDDVCEQLDIVDEDLASVEDEVFGEDSCCDCGCHCDDECDDDCDCDCCCHDDDDNYYEVECPSCGERICLAEETLLDEDMDCPRCGERLEFSFSDSCDCGCNDECDDDCTCGCKDEK